MPQHNHPAATEMHTSILTTVFWV